MSRLKQTIDGATTRYECEDLDAGLPLHAHAPGPLEHDVHCLVGAVIVYLHPADHYVVRAGETAHPDTTRWHGIVPIIAGSVFVNTNDADNGQSNTVLESPHSAPQWVLDIRDQLISQE